MGRLLPWCKSIVSCLILLFVFTIRVNAQFGIDVAFTESSMGKKFRIGGGFQDSKLFIGGGVSYLLDNSNMAKYSGVYYQMWMAKDISESIGVYGVLSRNIWNFSRHSRVNLGADVQYATHTNRNFNWFSGDPEIYGSYSLIETNLTIELVANLSRKFSLSVKGGVGGINRLQGEDAWEVSRLFNLGIHYRFVKQ